ncbi:FtsL-like putative cell division protein [Tenacibaculum sp. TC6]|uniref:FtsL-like putative cell division protein n=1 Tax=Tenacibaculum sp. TC6 TaxID=3423223 RepID=UPI003D361C93
MSKVRNSIYDVLRGGFLTDESSLKNWRMLIFVVLLLLVMISSAHSADAKVVKIAELNKEKRRLRAEYIDTSTILMRMKLESSIRAKVKNEGLNPAEKPPKKIKVTIKQD